MYDKLTGSDLLPGTLWERLITVTEQARRTGALQSVPTTETWIEQNGIRFLVRLRVDPPTAPPMIEKPDDASYQGGHNPFLPYEPAMYVGTLSDTHVCLLNKFNVVEHHLLVVTRAFEPQEHLLTVHDLAALWACMLEFASLGFYNGGKVAGASQRHKHLQVVPLPLAASGLAVPIEAALAQAEFRGTIGTSLALPFVHAVARLDPQWLTSPSNAAAATHDLYLALLERVGLQPDPQQSGSQAGPYNLLLTRQWMFLARRTQECCQALSVNALGFAGSLFVRNEQQWRWLQEMGPLEVLRCVGVASAAVGHV
jgi:sulfate adenylyltransferase (ADP) / ATP adenylyltransferase